jgi:hypothetical protein
MRHMEVETGRAQTRVTEHVLYEIWKLTQPKPPSIDTEAWDEDPDDQAY